MKEYWLITLQHYGNGGNNYATVAIDRAPVEWLIAFGNHREGTQKNIIFAQKITESQFERLDALRN